jgi:hypothetical protein
MSDNNVVDGKTLDMGVGTVKFPGIGQDQAIECICEVLKSFESIELKEFFDLIGDAQKMAREELDKWKSTLTSTSRFLKKKLTNRKEIKEKLEKIDKLKTRIDDGLTNIPGSCTPMEQIKQFLDNLKQLIQFQLAKLDNLILNKIKQLLKPIEEKLSQISNLISLMDALKFCEETNQDFKQQLSQAKNTAESIASTDSVESDSNIDDGGLI